MEQHTAGSLAKTLGAVLEGPSDLTCTGVASINEAKNGDVTFMVSAAFAALWFDSNATIGIVPEDIEVPEHDPSKRALLRVANADLAIASVLALFKQNEDLPDEGIHPSAVISSTATVGKQVRIGPHVVIADNAIIEDQVAIYSNVRVGRNCKVGTKSVLYAGAVIEYDCVVGSHCRLYANCTIGTDGFGYTPNEDQTALVRMPHIGNVVIGNHVDIGANSCVDRGKFASTTIGDGTKLDNMVQIGHNCKIGQHCVFAAMSGLAGSVQVGDWVQIGAGVGVTPHCKVGNGAKIGSKSGVMHDVPDGEEWLGIPARRFKETLRQWASLRKLPGIIAQISRSEDQ